MQESSKESLMTLMQAVSPFIDPITAKKIFFCDKGSKGDEIMARFFRMDQMDECLGGTGPSQFKFKEYEKQQILEEKTLINGHS